jgi:hypothetical protein
MVMTIVQLEELLNSMDNPSLTAAQEQHIEQVILPAVQRDLESYCNRPLEKKQFRERIRPDSDGFIWFSKTPVWEIISLQDVNGLAVTFTPPTVPAYVPSTDPDIEDVDLVGTGWVDESYKLYVTPLNPYGLYFGQPSYYYATYVAGFDCRRNTKVKDGIIEVAQRRVNVLFMKDVGLRQGSVEPSAQRDNRGPEWTPEELEQFDRYRRRVAV